MKKVIVFNHMEFTSFEELHAELNAQGGQGLVFAEGQESLCACDDTTSVFYQNHGCCFACHFGIEEGVN